MPLPNLIVIGAQKCGTSSLELYLDLHPEIAMARPKAHELNFFSWEDVWRRGVGWYEQQFRHAPVRGEKSNGYSAWPFWPFVPERMKDLIPDARLIYLVRDPVERLVTNWRFSTRHGGELRSIEELLLRLDDNLYVARGCYATQLGRYLPHFPQERILVVDSHDLRHDRSETMRRIYRFAGVDDRFMSPRFDEQLQAADEGRWLSPRGERIVRGFNHTIGSEATRRIGSLVPRRVRVLERPAAPRPVLEGELRDRLVERFAPEVERLRALTGQRFESWSV